MQYIPTPQEKKVIEIMENELAEWKDGRVWVNDRINYKMLGVDGIINKARKNYLGKFDKEYDEVTKRKKIFFPVTEDMVEVVTQNIDLDSADINIRATNPNGFSAALILRYLVGYFMRRNYFGEILNELLRQFCIDGTIVLKIIKNFDPFLKKQLIKTPIPDITNFFIDPSERNIQEAGAVIERNVIKLSEAKKYDWDNLEYIKGETEVSRLLTNYRNINVQVPYVEIYERWGDLPLWCITGKEEDKDTWVPTVAIVSNIYSNPVVHKIKLNKTGIKPYEECRFRKVFGRWHGRGVGEITMDLQSYINEIVNLRLNQSRIAQLGLFKFRKGSGITQQLLSSLVSGGGIPVTRMDDIQELRISDIKPSSYRDQLEAYTQVQRVTGGWQIGKGETLPADLPATTAVLQERGMRTGYSLLQENLGMFLSRVFEKHIIPLLLETISEEEIISIIGSPKDLKEIDESFINYQLNRAILNSYTKGKGFPPADYIEHLRKIYQENLKAFNKTRYFKVEKGFLKNWQYEVEVFVTGESFNKAVMVNQLNNMLMAYSRIPGANLDVDALMKEILDLMGLSGARFLRKQDEAIPIQTPREVPVPTTPQSETEMVGEIVSGEKTGRGMVPTISK